MITQEELKKLLDYDHETGVFRWKPRDPELFAAKTATCWNSKHAGKVAGWVNSDGYVRINLLGKKYSAHRLAFLWMTGVMPHSHVVHRDINRDDCRWKELRYV